MRIGHGLVVLSLLLGIVPAPATTGAAAEPVGSRPTAGGSFVNPVSPPAADAFGSPTVIRGRDGAWYAFGPGNPLKPGGTRPLFPILRSADLLSWTYAGDLFTAGSFPRWGTPNGGMWAPGIEYFGGRYHAYFTLTNLPGVPTPNYAIGVATAPSPTGPWTDSGRPLVEPRTWDVPGGDTRYRTIIDADVLATPDGSRYLYYGGFGGGVYVAPLSRDGLRVVGPERRLTTDSTYEGPYVVRRDGWYYLFVSSGNCCTGPVSGYAVFAGRSRSPLGPFADRHGIALDAASPGGTPVVTANGNTWVGTGHNAMVTDLAGQDWLTYNAIDRDRPYLVGEAGEVRRPLLIDRLDWIGGWPVVRAGAGASDTPVAAPAVRARVSDAFETSDTGRWEPAAGWATSAEAEGGFLRASPAAEPRLVGRPELAGPVRARVSVRLAGVGSTAGLELGRGDLRVTVRSGEVVAELRRGGSTTVRRAPLPPGTDLTGWHQLDVRAGTGRAEVQLAEAGLYDPLATLNIPLPPATTDGRLALVARGGADFDDVTADRLAVPVRGAVPEPLPGPVLPGGSDEFDGGLADGSTWLRGPAGEVTGGRLAMPVQDTDLTGASNSAALLLRHVPDDRAWIAETKVTMPFGAGPWTSFPQAGLVAYGDDDSYLRLTVRANRAGKIASFQKEMRFAGRVVANAGTAGPVAETTWLRLAHRVDPANGEHELRAASSVDGRRWVWAATYVLPAGTDLRIGLGAHGAGADAGGLVAAFDYLRLHHR